MALFNKFIGDRFLDGPLEEVTDEDLDLCLLSLSFTLTEEFPSVPRGDKFNEDKPDIEFFLLVIVSLSDSVL